MISIGSLQAELDRERKDELTRTSLARNFAEKYGYSGGSGMTDESLVSNLLCHLGESEKDLTEELAGGVRGYEEAHKIASNEVVNLMSENAKMEGEAKTEEAKRRKLDEAILVRSCHVVDNMKIIDRLIAAINFQFVQCDHVLRSRDSQYERLASVLWIFRK